MKVSSRFQAFAGMLAGAALAALIYGIVLISASNGAVADDTPIAQVDGEPITAGEFSRLLGSQRAAVIDYFKRTYGAEFNKTFWNADYGGEVPSEVAKERALQEVVKQKIILNLAKTHGLIQGSTYKDVLAEMAKENERRRVAVQAGYPVYGPVQFDENTFVDFYISKVLIELKEKLSGTELSVTADELKRHYELIKDELFALEDHVVFYNISVSYSDNGDRGGEAMMRKALETIEAVKLQLEQGSTVNEAVSWASSSEDALLTHVSEEHFNQETSRIYFKAVPELYAVLTDRPVEGRISEVIHDGATGQYVLAAIIEVSPSGYKSFDEQKGNVRKHYIDALFEDYLGKLIDNAEVNVIGDHYDRITIH